MVACIMVIDDNLEIIRLVREILGAISCRVVAAESGEQALAWLRGERDPSQTLDAVLLDVRLPGKDGFHILRELKAHPLWEQIPVILVTAAGRLEDKTRGLQMGADDYITKPFDAQELLARVKAVLRIRRTERMLRRRTQDLIALNAINHRITASLELDRVLDAALTGLAELLQAPFVVAILADEESGAWTVRKARAPEGLQLEGRIISPEGGARDAFTAQRPFLQHSVDEGIWSTALGKPPLDLLYAPLPTHEEPLGLLVVAAEEGRLTPEDLPLVENLAANLAAAIENARLYGELSAFATALEQSQNQLIQAEKMAAVGRLAASIAHEINNPLQAIQNTMHLAAHPHVDTPHRQKYLDMAQQEVGRLVHIVRRMLDFYRPASGLLGAFSLNDAVRDALEIANKRFRQAHVEPTLQMARNLPPVWGSQNQLTQVFLNIVINAIEVMEEGGAFWVQTAYHPEEGRVVATFRDSGPGIAPEARERLFEPFNTTKPTGTGLGLAISYGIIERHGGTIEVENPAGGGAVFLVQLPAYQKEIA